MFIYFNTLFHFQVLINIQGEENTSAVINASMAKQYFSSINTVILLKVVNKFFNKRNAYLNLSIVSLKPAACWITLGKLFTPVWWNWQSQGDRKVTIQIHVSIKTSRTYPRIPWTYPSYCDGFQIRRSWCSFGGTCCHRILFYLKRKWLLFKTRALSPIIKNQKTTG